MTPEIRRLNDEIAEADRHLRSLKNRLEYAVKTCQHVWGTPLMTRLLLPEVMTPATLRERWELIAVDHVLGQNKENPDGNEFVLSVAKKNILELQRKP